MISLPQYDIKDVICKETPTCFWLCVLYFSYVLIMCKKAVKNVKHAATFLCIEHVLVDISLLVGCRCYVPHIYYPMHI